MTGKQVLSRVPLALPIWALSAVLKLALLLPSALGVAFSVAGDGWKRTPWLWRWCADAEAVPGAYKSRWGVFYFWAIRNPVKVLALPPVTMYSQWGDIDESLPGTQLRWRSSGWLDSFRIVWGEPRAHEGKREFYIGWKLGSPSPNKFTIQLRPF